MSKSQNKTFETEASVEAFLETIDDERKKEDAKRIVAMMHEISGTPAKMWGKSIVGFGNYHYKYASGREGDFMKIGFSPRKQNLTLYIMPGFDRYDALMKELGKHKTGKSCLYIKRLDDVDWSVLRELSQRSFQYMTDKYG